MVMVIGVIVAVWILAIAGAWLDDYCSYNRGRCWCCGTLWMLIDLSPGERVYICPRCGRSVEVSYPVDRWRDYI